MKFRDIEKLLVDDGWVFKGAKGSHYQSYTQQNLGK
jgi:predicted RNA binding protein YcfA (HicA-like mRNA interferase family)